MSDKININNAHVIPDKINNKLAIEAENRYVPIAAIRENLKKYKNDSIVIWIWYMADDEDEYSFTITTKADRRQIKLSQQQVDTLSGKFFMDLLKDEIEKYWVVYLNYTTTFTAETFYDIEEFVERIKSMKAASKNNLS